MMTAIKAVTAKNAIEDKIKGLDLGADDYLTKPFHKEELNARLRSIVRRNKFQGSNKIIFNEIENFNRVQGDLCYIELQKIEQGIYKEGFLEKAASFDIDASDFSANYEQGLENFYGQVYLPIKNLVKLFHKDRGKVFMGYIANNIMLQCM